MFEATSGGVGDDGILVVGLDASPVGLIDAPALDAVLELVFLPAPTMQQGEHQLGSGRGRSGEHVDLRAVFGEEEDPPQAAALMEEILLSVIEPPDRLLAIAQGFGSGEHRSGYRGVRLALVGDELESFITQRCHLLGERAGAIEDQPERGSRADLRAEEAGDGTQHVHEGSVFRRIHPEQWAGHEVVHVVVGDARNDALFLHLPAFPDDVLARVLSQMIVHVGEDATGRFGDEALCVAVSATEMEGHGPMRGEVVQHLSRPSCGRTRPKQERFGARRREASYPFDAALAERERHDRGVQRHAEVILIRKAPVLIGAKPPMLGVVVEPVGVKLRHHEPRAEVLHVHGTAAVVRSYRFLGRLLRPRLSCRASLARLRGSGSDVHGRPVVRHERQLLRVDTLGLERDLPRRRPLLVNATDGRTTRRTLHLCVGGFDVEPLVEQRHDLFLQPRGDRGAPALPPHEQGIGSVDPCELADLPESLRG